MRILVTGFEPFGGATMNPALEAVRRLPATVAGAEVVTVKIPVVFGRDIEALGAAVAELRPDAYFTTLPVHAMAAHMKGAGIPAAVSYTAGTFCCNDLPYGLLHLCATEHPAMRGGFIHVPYATEQAAELGDGTPSMSVDMMVRGLTLALEAIIAHPEGDIAAAGGTEC